MLRIRPQQMDALAAASRQRFEARLLEHCRRCWSSQVAADGDDATRARIARAIERAGELGFDGQAEVAGYLDLTYVWGEDFDRRDDLPWVKEILARTTLSPSVRMRQLEMRTERELEAGSERREV